MPSSNPYRPVIIGLTLMLASVLLMTGAFLAIFVVPLTRPSFSMMMPVLFLLALAMFVASAIGLAGQGCLIATPTESRARPWAIASVVLLFPGALSSGLVMLLRSSLPPEWYSSFVLSWSIWIDKHFQFLPQAASHLCVLGFLITVARHIHRDDIERLARRALFWSWTLLVLVFFDWIPWHALPRALAASLGIPIVLICLGSALYGFLLSLRTMVYLRRALQDETSGDPTWLKYVEDKAKTK